ALSFGRLLCVPLFLWLLFGRDNRAGAAWLLAALGATDWVDGYIARRFDQVSTVGKVLDPVADRVLLLVGIVAILVDGSAPIWLGVAVLARELLVSAGVLALTAMGARRVDVSLAGKTGTFALMMAFPLFLVANAPNNSWEGPLRAVAWGCAVVGLAFSYWSAFAYIPLGRAALREGRGGRKPPADPEGGSAAGAGRVGSTG
ncbi:MAG TPA: CDP-alcohol phosphatidyltransferase family protein, partial [Acidimicrobiales bacterium]|nr:CDP-alcohol phosphatidyltransferase family protein [Acidimicrobiales bacterium]